MANPCHPQSLHCLRPATAHHRCGKITDGLAIDDCSKRAAKVTHMISAVALLDYEVVARHPERCGVIEFEVCLQGRLPFSCKRHPANDKRQIPEFEWSVQL